MKVSVVKADNYNIEIVDKAVNDAVNLIGGWKNFIKKGDKVLIKPNLVEGLPPKYAVTTHPEVLRQVIQAVLACGAIQELSSTHAELKSMRTHPKHLRKGAATEMLKHLLLIAHFLQSVHLSL